MKDFETKMKKELSGMLKVNEELEYVMYGQVAPATKKILMIFGIWIVFFIFAGFNVVSLPIYIYLIVAILLAIFSYSLFYDKAYVGKFGKRLFVYEYNCLGMNKRRDEVLLKNTFYAADRSSEYHVTIHLKFLDENQFIVFKQRSENKGLIRQSTNMKKIIIDIEKKKK